MKKSPINTIKEFLQIRRQVLNGTIGEYVGVFFLYFLILIPLTGFVILNITTQIFAQPGDATSGFLWLNTIDHTINPLINFTSMTNYPFGEPTGGITLVSYIVYWLPMRIISFVTDPVTALNIVMIFGYTSAAMSMYWLIKRLTGKKLIAFFAGYAVAFVPYAMMKSVMHLSYIFSGIFSCLVVVYLSFWQRPTIKKSIILATLLAVTFYTDGYFILMTLVLTVGMLIAGFIYSAVWREGWTTVKKRLAYIGVALVTFVVLISPLLIIQATQGGQVTEALGGNRSDISNELQIYRSNIADFVLPPRDNIFLDNNKNLRQAHSYNDSRSNESENNNYISFVIYILCAIGFTLAMVRLFKKEHASIRYMSDSKWRTVTLILLLCATTLPIIIAFMFSPGVNVHGVHISLPGQLFIDHNVALWRVMSRLFVIFNVLLVSAAAVSLWMITTVFTKNREKTVKYAGLITTICIITTAFTYTCYFPARPFDLSNDLPQTYYWLKGQTEIKSIAELPIVDPLDIYSGDYATAQIIHDKKIMDLKGTDGPRLNNALGTVANPELVNLIKIRKIDAVLLRNSDGCQPVSWGRLAHQEFIMHYSQQTRTVTATHLCTYFVTPVNDVDPVFVRFGRGFTPSPNSPDQSNVVFRDGGVGVMAFTQDDFKTKYVDDVRLTATLHNRRNSGDGWKILDDKGRLIAVGRFPEDGLASIDVVIHDSSSVVVSITDSVQPIRLGQVYISNTTVSRD